MSSTGHSKRTGQFVLFEAGEFLLAGGDVRPRLVPVEGAPDGGAQLRQPQEPDILDVREEAPFDEPSGEFHDRRALRATGAGPVRLAALAAAVEHLRHPQGVAVVIQRVRRQP